MREDLVFPAAVQGGIADVRVARIGRIRLAGEDAAPRDRPGALLLDDRRVNGHGELRGVHPRRVRLHPEQVAAVLQRLEGIGRRVGISARRIEQVGRGNLVDRLLRRVHQKDRAVLLHDRRQAVQPHRKGEMIALERPVDEDALLHVVAKGLILQVDPVVDVCIEHGGRERFRDKGVGFFIGQRHGCGRVRKLRRHVGVERLGLVGGIFRPGNRNRRRNRGRILGRRCFCVFLFVRARRSCRLRTLRPGRDRRFFRLAIKGHLNAVAAKACCEQAAVCQACRKAQLIFTVSGGIGLGVVRRLGAQRVVDVLPRAVPVLIVNGRVILHRNIAAVAHAELLDRLLAERRLLKEHLRRGVDRRVRSLHL